MLVTIFSGCWTVDWSIHHYNISTTERIATKSCSDGAQKMVNMAHQLNIRMPAFNGEKTLVITTRVDRQRWYDSHSKDLEKMFSFLDFCVQVTHKRPVWYFPSSLNILILVISMWYCVISVTFLYTNSNTGMFHC